MNKRAGSQQERAGRKFDQILTSVHVRLLGTLEYNASFEQFLKLVFSG